MAIIKIKPYIIDETQDFVFNNVTATGNLISLNADLGNAATANFFVGDGSLLTGLPASYANSNVAAYLPTYTGNISANYYSGNGSELSSITGANVIGQVGNSLIAGTVYTAAQPNITSVGTLSSLTISGLVTATAGGIKVGNIQDPTGTNTISISSTTVDIIGNLSVGTGGSGNVTASYFIGNGSQLTGLPASYANSNVAAYLPTYTGNYAGNNVTLTGNISTGSGSGNISGANYVIANYFQGDGSLLTGLPASYSNTNVAAYLPTYSGNFTAGNISTTGNITAAYFIGNGSQLTGLPASYSNTNVAAYLPTYSGNLSANVITANNATINGSITTGSGTGNISGANFVNANYFRGDGSQLSNITGGNVSGEVTFAATANSVAGANVSGQVSNSLVAGTVYTNTQPNITSLGTLTALSVSGNIDVIGNINVTGNLNYSNVNDLVVGDPLIYLGANNTGNLVDLGIVGSFNDGSYQHTGLARDHTDGTWKLFTNVSAEPTTVIDWANATYAGFKAGNITSENASLGNLVTANYFSGNGSLLTSITGANVTGQVGNALIAGTVYTNAQPNITSVGTLASLSVTGNLTAGNVDGGNAIVANYFVGDGSLLTGLPASYSNTNVENYLPTYTGNFSPSNLVVSTSANLGAIGNIIITGGSANYVLSTDGAGSLSWVEQSGGSSTSTTISVDNFTGDGSNNTFTLSVTPTSVNSVFVNYNGAFVGRGSYELDGADLTFGSIPANGASIEVTTIEGLAIGSGAFTTRTAAGDGSETDYTVTSGCTVSSVLVTIDGVLQTPTTDYTISGATLTFTTAPYDGASIQIRELSVASSSGGGASNISIRAQAMTMGIIFGG